MHGENVFAIMLYGSGYMCTSAGMYLLCLSGLPHFYRELIPLLPLIHKYDTGLALNGCDSAFPMLFSLIIPQVSVVY